MATNQEGVWHGAGHAGALPMPFVGSEVGRTGAATLARLPHRACLGWMMDWVRRKERAWHLSYPLGGSILRIQGAPASV